MIDVERRLRRCRADADAIAGDDLAGEDVGRRLIGGCRMGSAKDTEKQKSRNVTLHKNSLPESFGKSVRGTAPLAARELINRSETIATAFGRKAWTSRDTACAIADRRLPALVKVERQHRDVMPTTF